MYSALTMYSASTHHVATDCYSATLAFEARGIRRQVTLYRPTLGAVRGIARRWQFGRAPKDMDWNAFYASTVHLNREAVTA